MKGLWFRIYGFGLGLFLNEGFGVKGLWFRIEGLGFGA